MNGKSSEKLRIVYVFNLKGKPPFLDIRQRIVYSRLAPLRRPVSARRLTQMLGGLIDRRTTHRHLLELEKHDLVTQVNKRWLAREPQGQIAKHFTQTKVCGNDGRWHGCYASWKLPLPKVKPFPKRQNSTELYAAYWLLHNLWRMDEQCSKKRLAAFLGVTKVTGRRIVDTLSNLALIDITRQKCNKHSFALEYQEVQPTKTKKETRLEDSLEVLIKRKSGRDQLRELTDQLTDRRIMNRQQVYELVRSAFRAHDPEQHNGDGSALALHRLRERLDHKTAVVAADAIKKQAAARQEERRMLHQTRDSLVSRLSQTERAKVGGRLDGFTFDQLSVADTALTTHTGLTLDILLRVIGDPTTAPPKPVPTLRPKPKPVPKSAELVPTPVPVGKMDRWREEDEDDTPLSAEDAAALEQALLSRFPTADGA